MRKGLLAVLIGMLLGVTVHVQGSLSNQVLQLLTRDNSWTGKNVFLNLRTVRGVPSDTLDRLYEDAAGNLYFNGNLVAGAVGGGAPHNLLSTTHPDTLAAAVLRGSVLVGNATPAWSALVLCPSGDYLGSNGTDTVCATSAAAFTAIPGGQITGALAAVDGTSLTGLNATSLTSGTVPLARLSGLTTSQLSASAAITRAQLSIAAGITLTTDVTGILPYANGGTGSATAANNTTLVSSGSAWTTPTIPDCHAGTTALGFTQATNLFNCQAITVGAGSVTSVAMTVPTGLAISGSPITTSGTLALTLSNENANLVWAGPNTGAAAAPTFRSLVNADLPATAVTPGSYPKVTVNQQGVVTAGTATIALATDTTGTLARAQGGTGVTASGNNTLLIGTGTVWAPQTVTDCQNGLLAFTQSTSLFSCPSSLAASAAGTGTLGTTALPFASLALGTAATNNLLVTPATFAQGTVATVDDPALAAVKLPLVRRGTIVYTSGAVTNGTCSTPVTATVTGLTTTSVVYASFPGAPGTQFLKGIYVVAYPTANTINLIVCNPTAGSISPDSTTFSYIAFVP